MAITNNERISKALGLLRDGLAPKCEEMWKGVHGGGWLKSINRLLHTPEREPSTADVSFLLKAMKATWSGVFGGTFHPSVRSLVFEAAEVRNRWAHQNQFSSDDTNRALDSMERLLDAFGNTEQQKEIRTLRRDLMLRVYEQAVHDERRKASAKPTEGKPQGGLTPWREIITPHEDVRSGRFNQAEFAADLHEVAAGRGEEEYGDPKSFFARTYLTNGLEDLLVGAARRLSGGDGEPVIQLQTNFGGGKTHSMIALYHLASGVPPSELPGVGELLSGEDLTLPSKISRAVLVGHKISPSSPGTGNIDGEPLPDDVRLHTLWGHLAYQLGGKAGYELVRADDEAATNPGDALRALFTQFGPAVVLIDEWVAYARQLFPDGDSEERKRQERLVGGDFDTQFTFAQALTEAAAAVGNVVVLITVPASDIEVGGSKGKSALERLKNVVTRTAKQWQAASPTESFEIVRRRLFDEITADGARKRDGVIAAFSKWYGEQKAGLPSDAKEMEYRRRMEACYPIHPELFDRLFEDWSTLDKFQRTRGVLRLMALAISELWERGDQSLLIMPGNLPMDSTVLVSEMKKYLEEGWDPVIKADVDGENSLPLRIDKENKHFGRYSATRRVARTVYMGSAPGGGGTGGSIRGIDLKRVVLGCVQPGEPPTQFVDALSRLAGEGTYLYVDGASYWYSLQPNVTRLALDRAGNYRDRDADAEVRKRVGQQCSPGKRGGFSSVQVFVEGPGEVPDDDDGVRLVILTPAVTHSSGDENSEAVELAERILNQRDAGPRVNRNLLVFTAAAANRLEDLRGAAKSFLAWESIVKEAETLNLTPHQSKQAETKFKETDDQVESQIKETFTMVLTPLGKAGTSDISWQTTRVSPSSKEGSLPARVSKKLESEEKLIAAYSGVRVKMDLDRFKLWSERGDLQVRALWETYARYPYMPRLGSLKILLNAVSDGPASLVWKEETFAYAEAWDDQRETWAGVSAGSGAKANISGFVVKGERAPLPGEARETPEAEEPGETEAAPEGEEDRAGAEQEPAPSGLDEQQTLVLPQKPKPTRFYAQFSLAPVPLRGVKELSEILEHVISHLGSDVELSLEINASQPAGYDDSTQRTVSENAKQLGANGAEFEPQAE